MILKKVAILAVAAFSLAAGFGAKVSGQEQPRVMKTISSRPINQPAAPNIEPQKSSQPTVTNQNFLSRPVLTNKIEVAPAVEEKPLIKKTGSSSPINMAVATLAKSAYSSNVSSALMKGIEARYGIPYHYGSTGPNRYDCSGFVWSVFHDAGVNFERVSVRSLWAESEPVTGDDRFKFGTLVFLNGLGHIGIVADENGFYHASSSKGITYSKFEGYWSKRIVGFRRIVPKN